MKRIGIIGGMSYESTTHYYEQINRKVNERMGGLVSADLVLRSVNFEEYHELMEKNMWDVIGHKLRTEAINLAIKDECDYIAIATNTMHKVANEVEATVNALRRRPYDYSCPMFVHIGDCIAEECQKIDAERVLVLGTKFTMTEPFLRERLKRHQIDVVDIAKYTDGIEEINRIIFDELCHGVVDTDSQLYLMTFLRKAEIEMDGLGDAVILGCTELDMILDSEQVVDTPLIDSVEAHINKLVELCVGD